MTLNEKEIEVVYRALLQYRTTLNNTLEKPVKINKFNIEAYYIVEECLKETNAIINKLGDKNE